MTPERERLVRQSWAQVAPRVEEASRIFYDRLFELDPAARGLFGRVDMRQQGAKFMAMLGSIINSLDRAPSLVADAASLGRRHTAYGVRAEQYESVGAALIWMLDQMLGPEFTPEVRAAWMETYAIIAAVMKRAAGRGVAAGQPNG